MLKKRIEQLEKDLEAPEIRISEYHDLPFAILYYDPREELQIRKYITLLKTRLENKKKKVIEISLADIFWEILEKEGLDRLFQDEMQFGLERVIDTIHSILSDEEEGTIEDYIKSNITRDTPSNTIIFLTRAGILFPVYRTSIILENLHKKIKFPTILFYPGKLVGTNGLSFMSICEPNYNYRANIIRG